MSVSTWVNWTFIWGSAFGLCWICAARYSSQAAQWRQEARTAPISASGRHEPRSKPQVGTHCSH
jgi:hypothetical protein